VIRQWETTRPRNEALDCRIYARAAAWDMGLDRLQERHWCNLEAHAGVAVKTMPSAPEHQPLDTPVVAGGPPAPQMRSPLLRPRRLPVRSAYLNSRP
jgi:phage terminase large subunit GpA-like protein